MKLRRSRLTIVVAAVWLAALALTVAVPAPEAEAKVQDKGWYVWSPNHPEYCSPLAFDCYVIIVY
jgi:hypothetical protein